MNENEEVHKKVKPYSIENLENWIKSGLIPENLGNFTVEEMEQVLKSINKQKKFLKKEVTQEELLELVKKGYISNEDKKKSTEIIDFLLKNKKKLLGLLSIVEEKTFRQSQEIIDNKLAKEPKNQIGKVALFDGIGGAFLNEELEKEKTEPLIKGLSELTEAEDKLLLVLSQILSKRSENYNQNSPDYYMGNYNEKGLISINDIEIETARICISPHELYSTYLGRNNYNTDHSQFIFNALINLSEKNFLVTLNILSKKSTSTEKKFNKLRVYLPLFKVFLFNKDLSEEESKKMDSSEFIIEGKGSRLLFMFGPLFTNNIRDRYVEFPENIHLRIAQASGKRGRVPQCANLLRDLLFREKQQKRFIIKRDEEKLIHMLGLTNELNAGKRGRIQERLNKSFDIFLKIGLLESVEKVTGAQGQVQYSIAINENFK